VDALIASQVALDELDLAGELVEVRAAAA